MEVLLECNAQYLNVEDIEILGIQEDFFGNDEVTFKCPECLEMHKSSVYKS